MLRNYLLFIFTLGIAIGLPGCSSPSSRVAVLVEVPRPANVSDAMLIEEFTKAADRYRSIPGLERKYFTHSDSHFGGIYLWRSGEDAARFYDSAWRSRILSSYGQQAELTYFEAPVVTEGGSPGGARKSANSVVSIVRVSAPWYAPRGVIAGRMEDAVGLYTSVPGLDFKVFTIADEKKVGGIYLWDDAASAEAFYDATWHARILESYGERADVRRFNSSLQVINEPQS